MVSVNYTLFNMDYLDKKIDISGPLLPTESNCPTRVGEFVENVSDIYNIPSPRLGMIVYVESNKKNYIIKSLKSEIINGVSVDNARVDTYEELDKEAFDAINTEARRATDAETNLGIAMNDVATALADQIIDLENNTKSNAMQYNTLGVSVYADKAEIYGRSIDGKPRTVDFPAATTGSAGVMTAEDKSNLDNAAQGKDVPMLLRTNYYDPDDVDFVASVLLDYDGSFKESSTYCVTGYIPLNSIVGQLICTRNGNVDTSNSSYVGFYDSEKRLLFLKPYNSINGLAVWQYGVAFVRFSVRLYSSGHVQIEQGDEFTTEIGYGESMWKGAFPNNTVKPQSMTPIFGMSKTLNLINHAELHRGKAAYASNGEIKYTEILSLCASGFIEVKPLTTYTFRYCHSYFFLDADRKTIGEKIESTGTTTVTSPDNCRYMVINFYCERGSMGLYDLDATARMYEGDILYPYIPYGVNTDTLVTHLQYQSTSFLGNKALVFKRDSVSANTDYSTSNIGYPQSIKNNQIVFSGRFESFASLSVGRGISNNAYGGCRFEINETSIVLFKMDGSWIQQASVEHGLTMNAYIKVFISERKSKVLVLVQTLAGSFEHEFDYWGANGLIGYKSSTAMTDVVLSVSNSAIKSPVWMFGDSYYGADGEARQMYWLRKWGYDNILIQSFGGQGSNDAYNDLLRCLDYGTPRYLVWSLGMNDDNVNDLDDIKSGVWYTTYQKVRKICEVMNIELILTTIPEVRSSSCKNKDKMSEVVRNSGLRYIDAAKAVGSNAQGQWYGNGTEYDYQSTDNVHPSKYGAKAIANQFLIDFPEIMQY